MPTTLEKPPLEAIRIMADALRAASAEELVDRRGDVVEMLECSADFLSLQARTLSRLAAGDASAWIVQDDPIPARRRLAWTDAYTYFAAGAFAGAMLVGLLAR